MKGKFEIEVITPLFIGNGEKYSPFEYIFDRGFFNPINIEKLIEIKLREGNMIFCSKILDGLEKGNVDLNTLCKEYRIDYKKFARYMLSSPRLSTHDEVLQYIKSGGKVFIPGSSIKGALRSVLTKHTVYSSPESGLNPFTDSVNVAYDALNSNDDSKKRYSAKNLDDKADRKIFGMTYNSPFRFISVSDSDLQEPGVLNVYQVKILNICNGTAKWFNGMGRNADNPAESKSVFLEGIKEHSVFSSILSIGEVSSYIVHESQIKKAEITEKFVLKINEEIKNYIINEISFFKAYSNSTKTVADFYNELLKKAEGLKENEFLLQVGFGTGMLSKTIMQYLKDDGIKSKVAKISRHKYYGNIYPKTRRIVFESNQPKYVPGWIKCKLLPN